MDVIFSKYYLFGHLQFGDVFIYDDDLKSVFIKTISCVDEEGNEFNCVNVANGEMGWVSDGKFVCRVHAELVIKKIID